MAKSTTNANIGGAAFPSAQPDSEFVERGMSLRDYFAAAALRKLDFSFYAFGDHMQITRKQMEELAGQHALMAYAVADAMLAERDK